MTTRGQRGVDTLPTPLRDALATAVLPNDVAASFDDEVVRLDAQTPTDSDLECDPTAYWVIGHWEGDPITLDGAAQVWIHNHDAGFAPTLIASDLARLGALCVARRDYQTALDAAGDPADAGAHDALNRATRATLDQLDPAAAEFWHDQLTPSPEECREAAAVSADLRSSRDLDDAIARIDQGDRDVF